MLGCLAQLKLLERRGGCAIRKDQVKWLAAGIVRIAPTLPENDKKLRRHCQDCIITQTGKVVPQ